jgi:hypothetical protein
MSEVYRVQGAKLGNAYLLAESEREAIKVVADTFKLNEGALKAAPDKTVGLPSGGIILKSSGKTTELVPAAPQWHHGQILAESRFQTDRNERR